MSINICVLGVKKPLVELECTAIKMVFQSRPRSNGFKFELMVGGLFLRDKMTQNSIMPVLVQPQSRERTALKQSGKLSYATSGVLFGSSVMPLESGSLFEFVYEKKPIHNLADCR